MAGSSGLRCAVVTAVCLLYGCSSPLASRSPRWFGGTVPKKQIAAEPAEKPNPLKSPTVKKDSQVTTADAKIEAKTDGSEKDDIKLVSHDAETLKLINEELKHVSPEEREQLQEDLKALDSSMVRYVLRNMKMARQAGEKSARVAAQSGESPNGSPTAGASAAGPSGADAALGRDPVAAKPKAQSAQQRFDSFTADAGLGSADPWNQYATNSAEAYQSHQSVSPIAADYTQSPQIAQGGNGTSGAEIIVTPGRRSSGKTETPASPGHDSFGHSSMYNADPTGPASMGSANGAMPLQPVPQTQDGPSGQVADLPVTPLQTPLPQPIPSHPATIDANPMTKAAVAFGSVESLPAATIDESLAASRTMGKQFGISLPGAMEASKWREELLRLISVAEAETAHTPAGSTEAEKQLYLRNHVNLRMLYLMAGQQERALQAIPGIDAADQEFWQQVLWGVANYFDDQAMPHADDRASQTVAQFRSAVQRLQETARLDLSHVTFCHKITSFGSFDRFPRDEFSPGQPVLVYAEVNNFKSEPANDGQFRTILRSTVEIFRAGPNGELVERFEFPATEDLCRNFRRDYFHSYEFSIPQRISLGPHVLKLTVEDQLSQKVATNTLNFTVK